MYVQVPAEIIVYSLAQYVDNICTHHCNMVFKSVLADNLHQLLKVVYLRYGDATIHAIRIVSQVSLAKIALYAAKIVVGRNTEEGKVAFCTLAINGAECINLAERTAKNAERSELKVVLNKALGEVATVGAYTLVAVLGEVIVPVKQC